MSGTATLDGDDLIERLPELIARQNEARGTDGDSIPDFVIAQRLGIPPAALRPMLEELAATGRLTLKARAAKTGREFNFVALSDGRDVGNAYRPPRYTGRAPHPDDLRDAWPVLDALEDIEEELINAGIYETFVEVTEVAKRAGRSEQDTLAALTVLQQDFLVIWPRTDRVRSRMSEICRLVKSVKQRFGATDAPDAPYLIRGIRVAFRSRQRQRRDEKLEDILSALVAEFEGRRPHLREAVKALLEGVSSALSTNDVRLTRVQADSLRGIASAYLARTVKENAFVVTGDTGSGKTEAFALPLLVGALEERLAGLVGTKVIVAYPRIRLAVNQAERVANYLAETNRALHRKAGLSLGMQHTHTPANDEKLMEQPELAGGYEFTGFRCPRCRAQLAVLLGGEQGRHKLECSGEGCSWTFDNYSATRDGLRRHPPDVLITTTESLHNWLMAHNSARVFGLGGTVASTPPRAIVLDEIHLYDTIHGAQVTRLMLRLRHRIEQAMKVTQDRGGGLPWTTPLMIGMSATIGEPQAFWTRFTSQKPAVFAPRKEDYEAAAGRDYYLFMRPESESRGKGVSVASATIQALMVLMHNMRKRMTQDGPKHRGLIFVESIDRLKRLLTDYIDAEEVRQLWQYRLPVVDAGDSLTVQDPAPAELPGFDDGEVWYFDGQDPGQFAARRPVRGASAAPLQVAPMAVYSGAPNVDAQLAQSDLIFATTSLEVGFDDSALQLVYQHRAPRNVASFVQKKGRGGRQYGDRSIMAVMLSAENYRDALYYQNPELLVDPVEYLPALNEDNYFVQRGHAIAAALDAIVFADAMNGRETSPWWFADAGRLRAQIASALAANRPAADEAFYRVTSKQFRQRERTLQGIWDTFVPSLGGEPEHLVSDRTSMLPSNLFGGINIPQVTVTRTDENGEKDDESDADVAVSGFAPGNVTRRYGQLDLFWFPPRPINGTVGFVYERENDHGYSEADTRSLAVLAPGFLDHVPYAIRNQYPAGLPDRFFRPKRLFLARFGKYGTRGRAPQVDWWYCRACDRLSKNSRPCSACQGPVHQLNPKTTGRLMSFPVVYEPVKPVQIVAMPHPLNRIINDARVFSGYSSLTDDESSYLTFVNLIYGSEVTYVIQETPFLRTSVTKTYSLRTPQAAGAEPILYGFNVSAEGIAFDLRRDELARFTGTALAALSARELGWLRRGAFVYGFATSAPVEGDSFFRPQLAEFAATACAEASEADWRDDTRREARINDAARLWLHAQRFSADQLAEFRQELAKPESLDFVVGLLRDCRDAAVMTRFGVDAVAHGLEHALRAVFALIGGVADGEVVGSVQLEQLGTGGPATIHVLERGEWGNGATRLVHDALRRADADERFWRDLWRQSAACPIGDEEDFIRWLLRERPDVLREARVDFRKNAFSARARELPPHYLERAMGRPDSSRARMAALARLVLAEENLGADHIPHLELFLEVDTVANELALRLGRRGTMVEVSNATLTRVDLEPEQFPTLARVRNIYRNLADAPDVPASPDYVDYDERRGHRDEVRFVTFVERFTLSSCVDGCPACLTAACDLGPLSLTRNLVSRRLLRAVMLSALVEGSVAVTSASTTDEVLAEIASRPIPRWLVIRSTNHQRYEEVRQRLTAQFSLFEELVDFAAGTTVAIFREAVHAGT